MMSIGEIRKKSRIFQAYPVLYDIYQDLCLITIS